MIRQLFTCEIEVPVSTGDVPRNRRGGVGGSYPYPPEGDRKAECPALVLISPTGYRTLMPTTLEILDTSYPGTDSPPQPASTTTAIYERCWAVSASGCDWPWGASAAPQNVVVDDRLAANPINRIDPTGLTEITVDASTAGLFAFAAANPEILLAGALLTGSVVFSAVVASTIPEHIASGMYGAYMDGAGIRPRGMPGDIQFPHYTTVTVSDAVHSSTDDLLKNVHLVRNATDRLEKYKNKGFEIAFGLDTADFDKFAKEHGAVDYNKLFGTDRGRSDQQVEVNIYVSMIIARHIWVRLDGLCPEGDIPAIAKLGSQGMTVKVPDPSDPRKNIGNYTNWEIFKIEGNPLFKEKTSYYLHGKPYERPS
jgi:hypothetical protein